MSIPVPQSLTVGVIARRLGKPLHKIEYIIRSRQIAPCGRAGNALIYSQKSFDLIATELRRIAASKGGGL